MYYARHPAVAIRREHFGGIAFNKWNSKLLEVDKEACRLLELADGKTSLRQLAKKIEIDLATEINILKIYQIANILKKHGFLVKYGNESSINLDQWPEKTRHLVAPESVHLALTHKCNYYCQSCYVDNRNTPEMTTTEIKSLIDEMAEMKVFQLAIGGGEPFIRNDLIEIVKYTNRCGLISNITTNGSLITSKIITELAPHVGQIQLSVNGHARKLHEIHRQKGSFKAVLNAIELLQKHKIRFGLNVLICPDNLKYIEKIIKLGIEKDAYTINFIRPKPSMQNKEWYDKMALSSQERRILAIILQESSRKYPSIQLTVDCAFSFLMDNESPLVLQKRGIYGCTGAVRFITIHPDGNVYPCSFLNKPQFCGGNVIKDGFKKIWDEGLQTYRNSRKNLTDKCRLCQNKNFYFECRAIAVYKRESSSSESKRSTTGCALIKSSINKDENLLFEKIGRKGNTPMITSGLKHIRKKTYNRSVFVHDIY
ncbi:MAG: radical SAM/SPASM domain-containing protein [Candidatus Helarchaeota archaeon]